MWRREFSADFYNTPENILLLQRAARCWGELKAWLKENAPPIALSLAPGLSRAEMQVLDPDGKLPVSARAIYRIHNGQLPEAAPLVIDSEEARENIWNGLFGGYKFYEHIVNMRMPQLAQGALLAADMLF
jgi:cell wall assembly regulator SMI1